MTRDHDRIVWLFGKPYWWSSEEQRLTLVPAPWLMPATETTPPHPDATLYDAVLSDVAAAFKSWGMASQGRLP